MQTQADGQVLASGMQTAVDRAKREGLTQRLRDNQSLALGCVGGLAAAAVGAAAWAVISYTTSYQIGWMAVGVGLLVGVAVRQFGKGIDKIFGITGAVLALIGCLTGNLLTVCIVVSRQESIPLPDLLSRLNPDIVGRLMSATFSPMDLLFYGLAVYEGYRFSIRPVATEEPAS